MEDAFGTLVFVVAAVGAVVAIITLVGSGRTYRNIGRGTLTHDADGDSSDDSATGRDEEIRQMVDARNARRARRGEPPLDVDAELAGLHPGGDAGLRDEVRLLVIARNERRVRAGKQPLDVDAEVERRIGELT